MMQEISAPSPPPTGCPGLVFVFGGEVEGAETVVPDRLLFPALTGRDGRGRGGAGRTGVCTSLRVGGWGAGDGPPIPAPNVDAPRVQTPVRAS